MEIYFVFFFPPTKKKKETPPTLHTFANRTSRPSNQNLQKSAIFPSHHYYYGTFYISFYL